MRIEGSQPPHRPVADNLGDDGCGRDRRALLVAVDDRSMLGRRRPEPEAVDETDLCGRRELPEDRPHRGEVRTVKAVGVDLPRGDRAHRHLLGTGKDAAKETLPVGRAELLGVVQQRQRPDAVVA